MQLIDVGSLKKSVIKRYQRKQVIESIDEPEQINPDLEFAYQNEMTSFSGASRKKQMKSQTNQDD